MTDYFAAELRAAVAAHRQLLTEANTLESLGLSSEHVRHWADEVDKEIQYYEKNFGYRVSRPTGCILQVLPATG